MNAEPAANTAVGETIVVNETQRGRFQVEVRAGSSTFLVDEPVSAGGLGSGPNPYDLLSGALGSCTLMTLRQYANYKKIPLGRVRVDVTHHRASLGARDRFVRQIHLEGELTDAQRDRLLEIANRCPVHLTMCRGSDVQTTLVHAPLANEPSCQDEHMHTMTEACQ